MERPAALQERIFTKLFEQAEIAHFTPQDARDYEESIKVYRDLTNVVNTAVQKGENRRALEIAREMKKDGMSNTLIAKYTGLTIEQIEAL